MMQAVPQTIVPMYATIGRAIAIVARHMAPLQDRATSTC
jgi:hypothetical protein